MQQDSGSLRLPRMIEFSYSQFEQCDPRDDTELVVERLAQLFGIPARVSSSMLSLLEVRTTIHFFDRDCRMRQTYSSTPVLSSPVPGG